MWKALRRFILKHNKKVTFEILVYFLVTFIAVRILVYAFLNNIIHPFYLLLRGIHIHHLNFGILILAIVGYWALANQKENRRLKIAKLYGIGLALTFDEFGMWFALSDNYWMRLSYDAIIIISAIFLNIIYFGSIWQKIIGKNIIWGKKIAEIIRKKISKKK